MYYYNDKNLKNARKMRSNMTKEEVKLWNILRGGRLEGYKFKRQVPIGNYIVDFLCKEKMLVIEIDGGQHNEEQNLVNDNIRTNYLEAQGFKVIRFWNDEVWENIESVYEVIRRELM